MTATAEYVGHFNNSKKVKAFDLPSWGGVAGAMGFDPTTGRAYKFEIPEPDLSLYYTKVEADGRYSQLGHTHTAISNGGGSVSVDADGDIHISPPVSSPRVYIRAGGGAGSGDLYVGGTIRLGGNEDQFRSSGGAGSLDFYSYAKVRLLPGDVAALTAITTGVGINAGTPTAQLHVVNSNAAQPVLQLKGAASQSAALIKAVDSSDVTKFEVASTGAPSFWLNGSLKLVEVGAEDSGGTGYRALRVLN